MGLQELFDKAVIGLRGQGWQRSSEGNMCLFRGPNGMKCAIGHVLEDHEIIYFRDGSEASSETNAFAAKAYGACFDDVAQLQSEHDHGTTPKLMIKNFKRFAEKHHLIWPLGDQT